MTFKHFLRSIIEKIKLRWQRLKENSARGYHAIKNIAAESDPVPVVHRSTHWILWATLAFVILFLIWSNFAVLQESTAAPATIIPVNHVQSVQNMEGGIIKQILVHDGDIVDKDQVLAYLDPTRFVSTLQEAQEHMNALEIKIARITAEQENKPFEIQPDLKKKIPNMIISEEQLYRSVELELAKLEKSHDNIQTELDMTRPLLKDGAVSAVDLLHLERQLSDIDNQIASIKSRELGQLELAKTDLVSLNASLLAIQDRLDRTTIRSPVRGIVKQISLDTRNGVVMPGAEIMSVVPLEDTLLVEAQVKPSDIGFIHRGEEALIRITAYDSSIYGGLNGVVDKVSADTITDKNGQSYYLVHIKTRKNYLRTSDDPLYIIPGMTATVNILTGKRTVLNYLVSPIVKARENALHER